MPPGLADNQQGEKALSWGRIFLLPTLLLVLTGPWVDGSGDETTPILLSRATTLLRVREAIPEKVTKLCHSMDIFLKRRCQKNPFFF